MASRITIEFLLEEPTLPAAPHALHQESRNCSASMPASASSMPVQYRSARLNDFDFDIVDPALRLLVDAGRLAALRFSRRRSAEHQGLARTLPASPIRSIDALIDKIVAADNRATIWMTACRALDRVHPGGRYWVPHWYKGVALDRLLGHVRPPGPSSRTMHRGIAGNLVVRSRQKAAKARSTAEG